MAVQSGKAGGFIILQEEGLWEVYDGQDGFCGVYSLQALKDPESRAMVQAYKMGVRRVEIWDAGLCEVILEMP